MYVFGMLGVMECGLFVCLVNESLIQQKNVYVWDVVLYIYMGIWLMH